MAGLIAQAVEHKGFSFLHIPTKCITFCPEQTDWKEAVQKRYKPSACEFDQAAQLVFHEDGFQTGLPQQLVAPETDVMVRLASAFQFQESEYHGK